MSLSLTLTNPRQWSPGTPSTRVLTSGRLTIGRGPNNDWMLPDPDKVISNNHCVIEEMNGTFRLIDSSTNGVFINGSDQPVGARNAYILDDGDHIRIGDYEIVVAIQRPQPPVKPAPPPIPARRDIAPAPSPPAPPARPQPEPGDQDRLLKAFFAGAGVDPATAAERMADAERMMREAGEIFRIVVEGVIAVLEARRVLKQEFGAALTQFQPAENNPLKFTHGVEDTVRSLLDGGERGYLPPKQAFEEAFADIKKHQFAVLAGMQEAWMDLLRRLDPKVLERRLDEDIGLSKLRILRKARCWDAFIQHYGTVKDDADADYKDLFSRVFCYGYEKNVSARSKKPR